MTTHHSPNRRERTNERLARPSCSSCFGAISKAPLHCWALSTERRGTNASATGTRPRGADATRHDHRGQAIRWISWLLRCRRRGLLNASVRDRQLFSSDGCLGATRGEGGSGRSSKRGSSWVKAGVQTPQRNRVVQTCLNQMVLLNV